MACPSCGSDEWRQANLVHKEGLSTINTRTSSKAVGFGSGGVGFGVGGAKTKGTQQTELSKLAAPPKGYLYTKILSVALVICLLFSSTKDVQGYFGYVLVIACAVGLYFIVPKERKAHKDNMERYSVTRMCQRCGTFYQPAE